MKNNIDTLFRSKAMWLRRKILEMAVRAGAGHVAPAFSCIEILVTLYYKGILTVKPKDAKWSKRDRFILSKGQAAVALYAVLADLGFFPTKELNKFTLPDSFLGGHAEDRIPGVEAFTGSLGHGLSIGCGIALAAKTDQKKYKTIVLLGDGECHEGSIWEAAMFAGHHQLDNIMVIVDNNGLSATDVIASYLGIEPIEKKWDSFGWETVVVNGHSVDELFHEMMKFKRGEIKKPFAIIAKTIKGKGVSFMENIPIWHYRVPVGKELVRARCELGGKRKSKV
jgi:transketolase